MPNAETIVFPEEPVGTDQLSQHDQTDSHPQYDQVVAAIEHMFDRSRAMIVVAGRNHGSAESAVCTLSNLPINERIQEVDRLVGRLGITCE